MIDWEQCKCSDFAIDVDIGHIKQVGNQTFFTVNVKHKATAVVIDTLSESIETGLYRDLMKGGDGPDAIMEIMGARARNHINKMITQATVPWAERKRFQGKQRSL